MKFTSFLHPGTIFRFKMDSDHFEVRPGFEGGAVQDSSSDQSACFQVPKVFYETTVEGFQSDQFETKQVLTTVAVTQPGLSLPCFRFSSRAKTAAQCRCF